MNSAQSHHKLQIFILAAGKGTRMKNSLSKVLHPVSGLALVDHVVNTAKTYKEAKLTAIVSDENSDVHLHIQKNHKHISFAFQTDRLGTGHALKIGLDAIGSSNTDFTIILYGDTPFITARTISSMIDSIVAGGDSCKACILGFIPKNPFGYGRLVVEGSDLKAIIEEKELADFQKSINLCNSGVMAFRSNGLSYLVNKIKNNNSKGEYYLTDIVEIINNESGKVAYSITDEHEVMGINSQAERADAEQIRQSQLRKKFLDNGVILIAPETTYFSEETEIAAGVVVHPFNVFYGKVSIDEGCEIKSYCHIDGAKIGKNAIVGPFARLRPDANLGDNVHIGNYVEVKKSEIGKGTKINHLTYIGDAEIGENVNIGAGTITCNYDGKNKHKTKIGSNSFIGSNTILVAPVEVGEGAITGASSTILSNAPAGQTTITEKKQKSFNKK